MSTNPERAVSYVLSKFVTQYMDKDVLILSPNTQTREAARLLRRYETDDIIITDKDNIPIGIVTDQDILSKVIDVTVFAESTTLKEVMTTPLVTINQKATLQDALHKMRDNDIRKLPVISKKNKVIGIIYQTTIVDVIRNATVTAPRLLSPPVKAVLGNLGFVLQFAGVLLMVPAIVATVLEDTEIATGIYLTTVLLLITGFFLNSYGEKSSLNLQQASILVFASLFLLSLFGTIPYLYVFPSNENSAEVFANAFFSSAAGFTTGGISLFDEPENLSQSFTFFRSFTQLVGGMSFIYLVITAFYPESKLQSMRGFISGKTLHMKELFLTITVIFSIYIVIVATLLYFMGERDILDNFSLAMSTLSTGGFIPTSTILEDLLWQEHIVLMGAMILGALPFTFHYAFVRKKFLSPKLGKEVLTYFAILGSATILFVAISGLEPLESVFYSISASTTTGLQQDSLAGLNWGAHTILIILMFIGGCGFSTAGGLKIFRLFHLKYVKFLFSKIKRAELSSQAKKEVISTLIIIALFPTIAVITGLHLAAIEDVSFEVAFFEAVGVITTGGLSAGVIDTDTDAATKIVLGFLMIFGRLEIIAIIYIFVPRLA
ncbi:CBS domain-containing protein [Marine Group I thaumarchaeote]|uniref:CBS domain-containing protein n=1 Tax=Marine Group I thaumarchaeote TaxID=2511932 RepID=A0A7K4N7I7_9ARCH|nr:MAG: CBS domain-containing protein [Nitrosopumilus sp. YT1]NMI82749.1 CBS domain-containing protein [Candidatus Nitrosopumilus sp. MTA1]NWJ20668.1 CBS domain-containing protein [Marine Group I thaumarchaeote]NWJ28991.1 CBS domain-containing protein [Marine Group I thaumarchaeote]NWJ57491.1 CBS domain-containing protein [Marine Group I thaumarchaeote]